MASRTHAPSFVAVSFLSGGASERLPLKSGDLLVVRFDRAAVKSGLVSPKEILRYLNRGVEVHAIANLHAKVYVLGRTAFVGSANVSFRSEHSLVEAICESSDQRFVSACRRFVLSLRGDLIDPYFAEMLVPLYEPPKFNVLGRKDASRIQSPLSVVVLEPLAFDAIDDRAFSQSEGSARKRLRSDAFRTECFRWSGPLPKAIRRDTSVLCCTRYNSRKVTLSAPSRILYIKKYRTRSGERALIYLAVRKYSRERSLQSVLTRVPEAAFIKRIRAFRRISDHAVAGRLRLIWPTVRDGW
jgi:hypothetical protein